MTSDWLIHGRARWISEQMQHNLNNRINNRTQTLLVIKSLPLPQDIIQEFIISYKYDKLEIKYKRNYGNVLRELIRYSKTRILLNRRHLRHLRHLSQIPLYKSLDETP